MVDVNTLPKEKQDIFYKLILMDIDESRKVKDYQITRDTYQYWNIVCPSGKMKRVKIMEGVELIK